MAATVYDVLVIGSGAGGGPLAARLSEAGWNVLLLEKGPFRRQEEYAADEITSMLRDFFVPSLADEPHMLVSAGAPWPQLTYLGWVGNSVGGGTVRMGGFFYRFHPADFRMGSLYGPYEELADWPYDYDELEPYYTRVEWDCGISGTAGTSPCEGARSAPYPLPPIDTHPLTPFLEEACRRLGWRPFPTPRAVLSRPYQGRPACSYCGFCAGFGCGTGARSTVQETYVARALATGKCELRTGAMVREVTVGADGEAAGCLYLDAGGEHEVRASVVCICCSAVESARLLLLSKSARFPNGLANDSGLVGRYLQFHGFSNGRARFHYQNHPDKPLRDPHPFLECSVGDHYFLPEGVSDLPKGGLLRFGFPAVSPVAAAQRAAEEGPGKLLWGSRLERRLREYFHDYLTVDFEVFHDFIPNDRTYLTLDPKVRDRWGLPVARIHLDVPEHHRAAGRWLVDRGLEALAEMGADEVQTEEIGETAPYLVHGTCRAGRDPARSVLDGHCRAHAVPNLFVVDGSFMPTSGGASPTLTILANSLRTADHLIASAKRGEL